VSALLVAELRRIAARRAVRLSMVLVAVAIVAGGAIAFVRTSSAADATIRERTQQASVQREAQISSINSCLAAHGVKDGQEAPRAVANACIPQHLASAHDPRFHRQQLAGILRGSGGVLAILGLALGATLLGAEFASRGMTTLLTFETRRLRVFAAKIVTGMGVMAAVAFVALVALALAMLPALLLHGAPAAGEPGLATIAGIVGRDTALVALLTGIGMAIATLGRTTAAALGAAFAYLVVLENILGNFLAAWRPWLLLGNIIVFVSGQSGGGDVRGRSVVGAGIFLTLVTAGLLTIAATSFRQRDIA
jgi:ABC-2 type transport system permease protein